jgi:hypothetical protein
MRSRNLPRKDSIPTEPLGVLPELVVAYMMDNRERVCSEANWCTGPDSQMIVKIALKLPEVTQSLQMY